MAQLSVKPDANIMAQAIACAERGIYTTGQALNFAVVLVSQGQVVQAVGQGFHTSTCVVTRALEQLDAAEQACDCAYLTSEPSLNAVAQLAEAGVTQLIVACQLEPAENTWLKLCDERGIKVEIGLLAQQALALNHDYVFRKNHHRPFVRLKMAASLDGRTALQNGQSKWITSAQARQDVQMFRAKSDVILSGSGTVIADDPSLNVRWQEVVSLHDLISEQQLRQPARVIIDNRLQLDQRYRLFHLPGETYLVASQAHPNPAAKTILVEQQEGHICLASLMTKLAQMGVNNVWVEAGETLAGALFAQGLVDEFILYQAPKLMGSLSRGLLALPEYTNMTQVPELDIAQIDKIGPDLRLICTLK
ncbi:bifunctional diaminohydroxyphosphoribosylaminopyrimidine deaminase/5-amino-6-(5-phosphoribosylamino)uracil reductase RibD [Motilimonas sp. KMU-193]|uniref:bifunctional diaminohydroxyphosphoribosylaminopyrimidine deaminase/5-amino-6-(5-phosphoribosylamino)uracil reductase RibD n=1 Tax=Motilimonas sp. KMU-193 TaxID=3388668 RepID=UPI00396AFC7A